jgi:hypothetical protein
MRADTSAIARATGSDAHVGGTTAIFEDFAALPEQQLPLFIGMWSALRRCC